MLNEEMFLAVREEVTQAKAILVAITKQRPIADIRRMYELGQRDFGENRVPELIEKREALPNDIRWHFVGHLQRNKVSGITPFIHLIHAGDSPRLIRQINKDAAKDGRIVPVLLQYHIADEASKYGLDPAHPAAVLSELNLKELPNVLISGVMGMATYTDVDEQIAGEFNALHEAFTFLKNKHFSEQKDFATLSMGMSGDYPIALQRGSTMVRVGSLLFN
ncbi:YggS family pyridoxal phosphate-dependent enzyme [Neolewinella antarctica]|uniref:Pyridoxal phosphate homeostasis protein n=1 Tax=Neolewinella antarctica TaxID=442734 RepID=A0ABX0X6A3_9BACT|nr:YggS family pyridoxal phosphate-dependent enzyme [Neolewinella antarctica]NJC24728.1 hypothetical protein [Neolewinella antarctica]